MNDDDRDDPMAFEAGVMVALWVALLIAGVALAAAGWQT